MWRIPVLWAILKLVETSHSFRRYNGQITNTQVVFDTFLRPMHMKFNVDAFPSAELCRHKVKVKTCKDNRLGILHLTSNWRRHENFWLLVLLTPFVPKIVWDAWGYIMALITLTSATGMYLVDTWLRANLAKFGSIFPPIPFHQLKEFFQHNHPGASGWGRQKQHPYDLSCDVVSNRHYDHGGLRRLFPNLFGCLGAKRPGEGRSKQGRY